MFESIRNAVGKARDEHAQLLDQLQARRRELASVQQQPRARTEIVAATDAAVLRLRNAAMDQIRERGQRLSNSGMTTPVHGALPVDECGRLALSEPLLLGLLVEPLRQLARDALSGLPQGITDEGRAAEMSRINSDIAEIEAKLRAQQVAADEAGVNL